VHITEASTFAPSKQPTSSKCGLVTTLVYRPLTYANSDFLRHHNTAGAPLKGVRFITDAVHPSGNHGLDSKGGEHAARYLRDRLDNIPILVRTTQSYIEHTNFVKNVWLAGSTCHYHVAEAYIDQLAGATQNNCSLHWAQYNAS
jgi:hypothetical protein